MTPKANRSKTARTGAAGGRHAGTGSPDSDGHGGAEELRFEAALRQLEVLVDELDGGELELEDSLQRFEEGVRLVRLCSQRLQAAEVRLLELREGPEGLATQLLDLEEEPNS